MMMMMIRENGGNDMDGVYVGQREHCGVLE